MVTTKDSNSVAFIRPVGWDGWGLMTKMDWLRGQGYAADAFEAMGFLRELGEWPAARDLGLINGVYRPNGATRKGRRQSSEGRERQGQRQRELWEN